METASNYREGKNNMSGQTIYYYLVDVIYIKKSRGKKPPIPHRVRNVSLVSRAKTIAHMNRNKDVITSIADRMKLKNYLSLRVFNIASQKEVGISAHYKEKNYSDEFK